MNKSFLASLVLASIISANAQEAATETTASPIDALKDEQVTLKGDLEGLKESYTETKNTVDKLNKFTISGYTQFQYRYAVDTVANSGFNIGEYQGGSLPVAKINNNNGGDISGVLQIRRGRLKVSYKGDQSAASAELEILPQGVSLKDLQMSFKEPWVKSFGIKGGVFDRPFGYEIGYSSSALEVLERTRAAQILMPGEKDMGVSLFMDVDDNAPAFLQYIDLKAGLFSGNGGTSVELDDNKDFIGRFGVKLPLENIGLAFDAGVSAYIGKTRTNFDTVFTLTDKQWHKTALTSETRDLDRKYTGVDAQLYYDVPVLGGMSIKGEYMWGKQPGTAKSSVSIRPYEFDDVTSTEVKSVTGVTTTVDADKDVSAVSTTTSSTSAWNYSKPLYAYEREFASYYIWLTQNLGKKVQISARYDMYDPNTAVEEGDFKAVADSKDPKKMSSKSLTAADLAYTTISTGLSYQINGNTRIGAYYDIVQNEKVEKADANGLIINKHLVDDLKDNILAIRLQYKF